MIVNFYELNKVKNEQLKFAVLGTVYQDKWVFVRHKSRDTWELPGGHREEGETIIETAKRELYEETGAIEFNITPLCEYSVSRGGNKTFGRLFFCDVTMFEKDLTYEIQERKLFDTLPKELTYPEIQPYLHEKLVEYNNSLFH